MNASTQAVRTIPTRSTICTQCRRASTQAGSRYSTKTATRGLADELLRSVQKKASPRGARPPEQAVPPSRVNNNPNTPNAPQKRTPSIMDLVQARTSAAIQQGDRAYTGQELEGCMTRKFMPGDVYSPHDIGSIEMRKWSVIRRRPRMKIDIVDRTGVDYLSEYKNISLMQEFVTSNGRLLSGQKTGLRPVHQRKMAKAVRRASGIGLIPKTYRHPELLKRTRR